MSIIQPENAYPPKYDDGKLILRRPITYTADQANKTDQLRDNIIEIEPRLLAISFRSANEDPTVTSPMRLLFSGEEDVDGMAIWGEVDAFVPEATEYEESIGNLKLLKALLQSTDTQIVNYVDNNATDLDGAKGVLVTILKVLRDMLRVKGIKLD